MASTLAINWLPAVRADDQALRRVAARFADVPVDAISVVRACRTCGSDQHGKPQVVRVDDGPTLHVSLARSADRAVIAVTDSGPVGVDIEATAAPEITTWVRIESLVKATGYGLQVDPDSIQVSAPESPPRLLTWPAHAIGTPVWMFDLDAPVGFTAGATVLSAERPLLAQAEATPEAWRHATTRQTDC